eukprot:TRINITY_DN67767_c0_g1_i11.p1 TRINITY_DN67767_c0_g1~~TRINITY_DN67767_c0_g1_i11.p1  ORF type:complete len:597 (+),score=-62.83 TRINITY_DN67767_c0_g1_i11:80-1870(+)
MNINDKIQKLEEEREAVKALLNALSKVGANENEKNVREKWRVDNPNHSLYVDCFKDKLWEEKDKLDKEIIEKEKQKNQQAQQDNVLPPPPPVDQGNLLPKLFEKFNNRSASALNLKGNRKLYDIFLQPCSPNSFIPNERLRNFRDQIISREFDKDCQDIDYKLQCQLRTLSSWENPDGGSETILLDRCVNKVIMDMINKTLNISGCSVANDTAKDIIKTVMCKSVKSEYRIQYTTNSQIYILFTSEAKGIDDSHFMCLIQALEIAGDSAIHLSRNIDMDYNNCSIPGIIVYGDKVQFYGVYLVDQHFPVVVLLSPPLSYTNVDDRKQIISGILVAVEFIKKSIELIEISPRITMKNLFLNYDGMFFKPIRCDNKDKDEDDQTFKTSISSSFINVERIMYMYEKIHQQERSKDFILFPVGLMRLPDNINEDYLKPITAQMKEHFHESLIQPNTPVMIFPKLTEYSNSKPDITNKNLVDKYIDALTIAVNILNNAGVAHMDLRHSNIMWLYNSEENSIDLKVIDFEDAVLFNSQVRFPDILKNDIRYPPMDISELEYASSYHNNWFLNSIELWLEDTTDIFLEFMGKNREKIYEKTNH